MIKTTQAIRDANTMGNQARRVIRMRIRGGCFLSNQGAIATGIMPITIVTIPTSLNVTAQDGATLNAHLVK
jgi:hypothetical protein